jgi:hypothetical protein
MKRYESRSGNAGVIAYDLLPDAIILQFQDDTKYLYTHKKPGKEHVAQMKLLAAEGKGLTTYVNQHVRENYEKKL